MQENFNHRDYENLKQHINDVTDPIKDSVGRIDKHLEKLNGQVGKNTEFRNKLLGGFILVGFVGLANVVSFIVYLINTY